MMDFKQFKETYEKVPVEEYSNHVKNEVLVSVCVQTYQHAKFIGQCLDGILMQKTDFEFEILLGEDNSSDGTREICLEYADRFPEKIKLFLHSRDNNIKVNNKPTGRFNFIYNLSSAQGKYIALCEGDDYWTDPQKLQKQVDFLEAKANVVMCGTAVTAIDQNNHVHENLARLYGPIQLEDALRRNPFSTCTVVFKTKALDKEFLFNGFVSFIVGDWILWCKLLTHGKGHNFKEKTAQYNIHSGGAVSGLNRTRALQNKLKDRMLMMDNFPEKKRIIKNYGYKIIFHFLWKSLLLKKVYFKALIENRHIVKSFIIK